MEVKRIWLSYFLSKFFLEPAARFPPLFKPQFPSTVTPVAHSPLRSWDPVQAAAALRHARCSVREQRPSGGQLLTICCTRARATTQFSSLNLLLRGKTCHVKYPWTSLCQGPGHEWFLPWDPVALGTQHFPARTEAPSQWLPPTLPTLPWLSLPSPGPGVTGLRTTALVCSFDNYVNWCGL